MKKYKKQIDPRIPKDAGKGGLDAIPAVQSPWGKLVGIQDTMDYITRISAVQAALMFEAMRILVPDYDERCKILCDASYEDGQKGYTGPNAPMALAFQNVPPFIGGGCCFGFAGDYGDEVHSMRGRVNDFGYYRVEKELDSCPIDICGSELGRATTVMLESIGNCMGRVNGGPDMDLQMVEAKCCGDLHCRLIGENRERYPMPPHERADCYGPVATEDQIRYTPEENIYPDCQYNMQNAGYKYTSATVLQLNAGQLLSDPTHLKVIRDVGVAFGQRFFRVCIANGRLKKEEVENCLHWVFEGAGKAMFTDKFAIKGLRDYLGAPESIQDGRILGGYIEMILQTCRVDYEIEKFNKEEVIYSIDRTHLTWDNTFLHDPLVAMWNGMAKTLVSAMYSCWEEKGDTAEEILRIKIARRSDKRCS